MHIATKPVPEWISFIALNNSNQPPIQSRWRSSEEVLFITHLSVQTDNLLYKRNVEELSTEVEKGSRQKSDTRFSRYNRFKTQVCLFT